MRCFKDLPELWDDECGATAVEYGLLAALLAIAVLVSMTYLGNPIQGLFVGVRDEFDTVNSNL